ncbi:hypothetical protein [Halalkalibacter flavus]|uniref:hypothetical protein n=1 Tax=Halalkalibacter flavus TaxID=3090668 RepID=UPI002FC86D8C
MKRLIISMLILAILVIAIPKTDFAAPSDYIRINSEPVEIAAPSDYIRINSINAVM